MTSSATPAARGAHPGKIALISLLLAILALAVFGQAVHCGFISFDDDRYVDHNPALEAGLSVRGLVWAVQTNLTTLSESAEYWEPLTLVTRLADYQAYGFQPWGHHLTSVLLHVAAGLVLFGALRCLTGALWRSALVSALFLVHPMHVEPVLWLSARKDLVNGLFYVAALWAYGWYVRRPNWRRYLLVFAAALAANMGKPMAVSLPFVLLLLDFWPLRRWPGEATGRRRHTVRLLVEKAPLFLLTFGVAALAVVVQKDIGALDVDDVLPLPWRLGNAAVAVFRYAGKAFVPIHLVFFYPHPGRGLNLTVAGLAALGVASVSILALCLGRSRPWLTVGWFWFLVVLGPVLGIIQIGDQAMADRYSYLAFIGLFIAVVWQVADWLHVLPAPRATALGWIGGLAAVCGCAVLCFIQVRTWQSSETVYRHALAVDANNYLAQYNLGAVLWETGRRGEAMQHFQEAVRLREPVLRRQLADANAAAGRGAFGEAIPRMTRVLMIMPWRSDLHHMLGTWLAFDHQPGKALVQFNEALKYRPDWVQPRVSIAAVLLAEGQAQKAEGILRDVLVRDPGNADAQGLLKAVERGPQTGPPTSHDGPAVQR
jgi:tetratricopeptide (TPR) repeat protein